MRIGNGFDIHRLVSNRKLVIGGIDIPFNKGLLGHSDADVLIHALCDALLGAAGLGDIGLHFPDNKQEFKNIYSIKLLEKTYDMIKLKSFSIVNIDSIIYAETPKIAPFRERIKNKIALTLKISPDYINVKATTTEGLGIIGQGKGISAECFVLLE